MSFVYPLGLLALIGIPILIIIYIIKNKYTEQVIASTYLWTLSEKFLKKRLPINKLMGIISLILQIVAVLFISLAIAQPVLFIKNAAHDYCFILDGSGSMNIETDGKTRFDSAKEQIAGVIKGSMKGSTYTLVFAADTADEIFKDVIDKDLALELLDNVSPAYTVTGYADAMSAAQDFFDSNPSVITYLITDKSFADTKNVKLINVSSEEENYAVYSGSAEDSTDTDYRIECKEVKNKEDKTYSENEYDLAVSGYVTSYESDVTLTVRLYVDGAEGAADEQTVDVVKLEPAKFILTAKQIEYYKSVRVVIVESDALALDNEITVYNEDADEYSESNAKTVLFVSDYPSTFIISALSGAGIDIRRVTIVAATKYLADDSAYLNNGYGLYIYESCNPETLPSDGAVWFINPSVNVQKSGFMCQGEEPFIGELKYNTNTSKKVTGFFENMKFEGRDSSGILVSGNYQSCQQYKTFTNLLYCGNEPVVFAGTNDYNNREVVFAFDFRSTNPLKPNYVILFNNLLRFTFPNAIDRASSFCGDTLKINVPANCQSVRIQSPGGKVSYPDTSGTDCDLKLEEVGIYTVTVTVADVARTFSVYAYLPAEESASHNQELATFAVEGEADGGARNGIYDDLLAVFILLALVFAADWMVYCYEQYQLR